MKEIEFENLKNKTVTKLKNCTAKITDIDVFGELTVEFNATIQGFSNSTYHHLLNTSVVDIYIKPGRDDGTVKRNNSIHLNFTWNVISFQNTTLKIQLNFRDNLMYISPYLEQDILIFHIKNMTPAFYSPQWDVRNFTYNRDFNERYVRRQL